MPFAPAPCDRTPWSQWRLRPSLARLAVSGRHPSLIVGRLARAGGTLRYGISAEIVTLGFNQSNDFEILQGLYDPFSTYETHPQPVPASRRKLGASATHTDQTQPPQRRPFHNGREFTSDDVAYNLERTKDPTRSSPVQLVGLAKAWTIETPDKYTVI